MLQNPLYTGIVDVPDYAVCGRRGDFEPLISEEVFYRVQGVLSGRVQPTAPRQRNRPDFPLRGFVRCSECGRGLTGSWSKGRHGGRYAYYHCRPKCHAVNIPKARLEGLFVDELERLQPTPGYMRLLKESVLRVWEERKAAVHAELEDVERKARTIHQKLDRLDETFIFARAIDLATYERQRDRLREELTLVRHSTQLEELDVEGVLAFAERVLPKASDLWVHASLDQRQRLQQLFFPDGVPFDGKRFNRTAVNASVFSYLRPIQEGDENLVDQRGFVPARGEPEASRGASGDPQV